MRNILNVNVRKSVTKTGQRQFKYEIGRTNYSIKDLEYYDKIYLSPNKSMEEEDINFVLSKWSHKQAEVNPDEKIEKASPKKKIGKKIKKKEERVDTRLSYSSATLLKNCETRYCHHKAWGTPKDSDYEDKQENFNIGKAFHWIMETSEHTEDNLAELLDQSCKAFEVEEYKALIHALSLRYLQTHIKSGLSVIKCEQSLSNADMLGFIDVILGEEDGGYWFGDMKTSAWVNELLFARLKNDPQLNTYSFFHREVASALGLDPNKFRGCRYRVVTKAKLKQKASESYVDYVKRLAKNVKSYDIIIPIEKMNIEATYDEHLRLHARSLELRAGEVPTKNLSYCDSYFSPCPYWSHCHGEEYSKCKSELEMITSNNV